MIERFITAQIQSGLRDMPAVALLGPRQVGKTTLALACAEGAVYLDLESPQDMAKMMDAGAYLDSVRGKLVILDEIQRMPDVFAVLRGVIDRGRREGDGNGRFLLLGSASSVLLRQSSESLAGRIRYLELAGLNPLELKTSPLDTLWWRGGFPRSYLAATDVASSKWREDFIRTYVERDIPQLGLSLPAATLRRFWTMLGHLQGSLLNASNLAASLDLSHTSIRRYVDLMVDLLLVRRLQPWQANIGKRLVKSPKVYVRDSGLLHQLLGIFSGDALLGHPVAGASWEGFVIENLLAVTPASVTPFFYRSSAGAELDLLLQCPNQDLWAIEIKRTSVPKVKRGFYTACSDLKVQRKFLVYNGTESFPLSNEVNALGIQSMMDLVAAL